MHNTLIGLFMVVGLAAPLEPPFHAPVADPPVEQSAVDRPAVVTLTVIVPLEEAEVKIDGTVARGFGTARVISFTPRTHAEPSDYDVHVSWKPNAYTLLHRNKSVAVKPGDIVTVDLASETPRDRAEVIYVPTPQEVAEAMVALAGVAKDDVVFELGSGDGRVIISAVQHGLARKGVGIDINEDLVRRSKENVDRAGLADRLEIRHGDIFDDRATVGLGEATVVMLYMSDELNLLLRPKLLRTLKPGTRIVSHRFLMGDWQPDQTERIVSGDAEYALHLWIVK